MPTKPVPPKDFSMKLSPRLDALEVPSKSKLPLNKNPIAINRPKPPSDDSQSSKGTSKRPRMWTKEEDRALIEAVNSFGEQKWKAIAENVGTRSHTQCLQRWKKVVAPKMASAEKTGGSVIKREPKSDCATSDAQKEAFPHPSGGAASVSQHPDPNSYRQMAAQQLASAAMEAQQRAKHMENLAAAVRRGDPVPLDNIRVASPKTSTGVMPSLVGVEEHFQSHPEGDMLIDKELNNGEFSVNPEGFIQNKIEEFGAIASGYNTGGMRPGMSPGGLSPGGMLQPIAPQQRVDPPSKPLNKMNHPPAMTMAQSTTQLPKLATQPQANVRTDDQATSHTFGLSSIENEIKSMMERHREEQAIMQSHHQLQMQQLQMQQLYNLRLMRAEEQRVLQHQRELEFERELQLQMQANAEGRPISRERPQKKVKLTHEEVLFERRRRIHEVEVAEVAAAEAEMIAMGTQFPPNWDDFCLDSTSQIDLNNPDPSRPNSNGSNLFSGFDETGKEYILGHPMEAWDEFFEMSEKKM
ncbi:hypothetical protein TrCOL_g6267 [Triparma columacea]|uniref:Uncharacterized protein n=1 Tax=Triparma columacea TaxID=722753 RepID=A0A9W7G927_9STRA|nr:hypothetical protein TrCOL_g6267 [Triparma columacea]